MTPEARNLRPLFLLGMPRSGTTWLSQIVESSPACAVRLSPNFSYPLKHQLNAGSDADEWYRVLQVALASDDPFMTQNYRRETGELGNFPAKQANELQVLAIKDTRFHDLYLKAMERLPQAKLVYIVRHPAASLWSWRSCKEFPADADFSAHWRDGACRKGDTPGEYWGFDDWKQLTRLYGGRAEHEPARYHVLHYESLVAHALATAASLFRFIEVPLTQTTRAFLRASQSAHDPRPYAVFKRKTVSDAWRKAFPPDLLERIEAESQDRYLRPYVG